MSKEREPIEPSEEAEREAEEARLLEDLAGFEATLPHGRAAATRDRALAIVYEDEARSLERGRKTRGPASSPGREIPPRAGTPPAPEEPPGQGSDRDPGQAPPSP
jgi:hypothetical protein